MSKIIIVVLTLFNLLLLFHNRDLKKEVIEDEKADFETLQRIDSLTLTSWSTNLDTSVVFGDVNIMFLFSKKDCQNCIDKTIDLILNLESDELNIFITAVDIVKRNKRIQYLSKFRNSDKFFSLKKAHFTSSYEKFLPLILVLNKKGEIVLGKNLTPDESFGENPLFWRRFEMIVRNR